MGVLTVRNVDEELKRKLRVAAAENGISMEAHVRLVLRRAVEQPPQSELSLLSSIRSRFAGLNDVVLDIPKRSGRFREVNLDG